MSEVTGSPWLETDGAVAGDGLDASVAAHYGDPLREQRTFVAGGGVIDRSNRGVITLTGPDRVSWLHTLTTQEMESLRPGVSVETLVLDPHGHIEHHLSVVDDGTTTWVHVEPETAPALVRWLLSMRFMTQVEVADESDRLAILTVPLESNSLADLGALATWQGRRGQDLFVPRHLLAEISVDRVGLLAWEALRIADLDPRVGVDTDERSIPNESRLLHTAVHLNKGCYRGQETVARVANLGQPPRRTLLLQLDGAAERLPVQGAQVEVDGRSIGIVRSSARHYEMGPIALAVVKRAAADQLLADLDSAAVEVDGMGASLEADPMQAPKGRAPRPDLMRFA